MRQKRIYEMNLICLFHSIEKSKGGAMINESAKELWENFNLQIPNLPSHYELLSFGDNESTANEAAALVLEGLKTARTTLLSEYEDNDRPVPQKGDYSIILDGNQQAIGVVQTLKVSIMPFDEVTDEIAYEEGEGDRTLTNWRKVYQPYFQRQCENKNQLFSTTMEVVCEQFELVYAA